VHDDRKHIVQHPRVGHGEPEIAARVGRSGDGPVRAGGQVGRGQHRRHAATIPETRRDTQLTTVGPMSDIVDDKKHIRGTIDLSNAVWQRAAGSEELPGPHLEIAFVQDGYVAMRSSENPVDSETLLFTPSEWEAFVLGAKDGEFDVM
jgi:Domain of unknown function (DUF397)